LNNGLTDLYIVSMAIDPVDPSKLSAGTLYNGVFALEQVVYTIHLPLVLRNQAEARPQSSRTAGQAGAGQVGLTREEHMEIKQGKFRTALIVLAVLVLMLGLAGCQPRALGHSIGSWFREFFTGLCSGAIILPLLVWLLRRGRPGG